MKIVLPHHNRSLPVTLVSELRDTQAMANMLDASEFGNHEKRDGFALHHSQVQTEDPLDYFVLREDVATHFPERVICNARIIEATGSEVFFEACLSFPFRKGMRTRRYTWLKVEAEVPVRTLFVGPLKLKTVQFEVSGLDAFIVQHEILHAKGQNIFNK